LRFILWHQTSKNHKKCWLRATSSQFIESLIENSHKSQKNLLKLGWSLLEVLDDRSELAEFTGNN
jgi:hypothetical protein